MKLVLIVFVGLFFQSLYAMDLGSPRVYKSSKHSSENMTLTLIPIGLKKSRLFLAQIKAPGYKEDNKHAVYQGNCETTKCHKIFFKEVGGVLRNFVSESGYYGDYISVMLSGRKKPHYVNFDKTESEKTSSVKIYQEYLRTTSRLDKGTLTTTELSEMNNNVAKKFHRKRGGNLKFMIDEKNFTVKKLSHLLGMGSIVVDEVIKKCSDPDYKSEIKKVKTVKLIAAQATKGRPMALTSPDTLSIFLSESLYNPRAEATLWLESL